MSLFVHYDNQTILWETIQQHPYVTILPPTQRASWFKDHIQSIYEHAPASWFAPPMTTEKLNHLNQQAMQYMVNDLKNMVGAQQQQPQPQQQIQRPSSIRDMNIGSSRPHNDRQSGGGSEGFKDKALYDQFLQKQQEMESMLQNKQVNPIDFKISEVDEPIANIDELIQQQLRDRELDIMVPSIHPYNIGTVKEEPLPTKEGRETTSTTIQYSSENLRNIEDTRDLSRVPLELSQLFTEVPKTPKHLKIHSDEDEIMELQVQEIKHVEFQIPTEKWELEERFVSIEERLKQMEEQLQQHSERICFLEQIQKSYLFKNPSDLVVLGDRRSLCEGILPSDQEEEEELMSNEENEP